MLASIIWGVGFVAQKTPMEFIGPIAFNALRFGLGGLVLGVFAWGKGLVRPDREEIRAGLLLGSLLFVGSVLQQIGVSQTSVGKTGFITGLYVILIPILLRVFWRERVTNAVWLGAALGACGLYLLCIEDQLQFAVGDLWVLACAVTFAVHVIFIGKIVLKREVLFIAAFQNGVCAVLSGVAAVMFETTELGSVRYFWPELVFSGVMASAVGFYLQAFAQRVTPPSDAAIIMALETVFGALAGWYFLGELLSARQLLGCGLIFSGIIVAQISTITNAKPVVEN